MTNDIVTKTNDGYVVEIFAKTKTKLEKDIEKIAEGISVLETLVNKTEEEQFLLYKEIAEKMEDCPVRLKTFEKEKNIEGLKVQLKAILRAGAYGDISIIFPKISSVIELNEYKEILEDCKFELKREKETYRNNIKIGIIVEIPSAALMSYELAKECDFLFIETNSLFNYTFGGRKNIQEVQKIQPAIIKLIQQAVEGAHDAGIFCGICGELVEKDIYIPLLIGLGIDEFSIEYKNILDIRKIISGLDKYDCKELAEEVVNMRKLDDIEKRLNRFIYN